MCVTLLELELWWLKIWAGKNQRAVLKIEEHAALADILQQSLLTPTAKLSTIAE